MSIDPDPRATDETYVGRDQEQAELQRRLEERSRVLTIRGAGGR